MDDTLNRLVSEREALLKKLKEIGDFRRGTISVNYRKCGKKNCACVKPGHPGHGPQYLWNTTIKGKSYAKNLKLGPELKKTLEETDNYKVFLIPHFFLLIPAIPRKPRPKRTNVAGSGTGAGPTSPSFTAQTCCATPIPSISCEPK